MPQTRRIPDQPLVISGENINAPEITWVASDVLPQHVPAQEELMQDEVWGRRLLRALRQSQRTGATGQTLEDYLAEVAEIL